MTKKTTKSRTNQYGLHPLGDHTPLGNHLKQFPVDIIAVHGMNGDAFNTWTSETGVNWVEDFLPAEFPGARVFTFGYPADIFVNREAGTLRSHAGQLLNDLTMVREREYTHRPIIFICHSMGGIVVKKALNMCVPEMLGDLHNSVKALLFLATPHSGSAAAETAKSVAKFGNAVTLGMGLFDTAALKTLAPESNELHEISTDFRKQVDRYDIYSFHEGRKMPWPSNKLIVNKNSGSLHSYRETPIPMPGYDHRSIARFDSVNDNGYKLVIGPMRKAIRDILKIYLNIIKLEDEPCLQSLSFSTQTTRFGDIKQKSGGGAASCKWIFSHQVYQTWRTSSHGLLWIRGHPGTGKSTLMASISSQTQSLSFFFDGNGTALQKSQLGMYRSLLYQIYRSSLAARTIILDAYQEKVKSLPEDWQWHLTELQELLFTAIDYASKQMNIVILVDALDEVVEEEDEKAAEQIIAFFHRLNNIGRDGKVKVCFSSRHYPNIHVGETLEITVEEHNKKALELFVVKELSEHVESWQDKDHAEEKEELVKVIVQRANRQFLWASIRVPMVTECLNSGSHSLKTVHKVLENESDKLSDLYQKILTANMGEKTRSKTLALFQWIALSHWPLSLGELRYAIASDECTVAKGVDSCEELEDFVESDERMEKLVKSLSGGLVMVSRHTNDQVTTTSVRFIHKTVYDFVMSHGLMLLYSAKETPCQRQLEGILEFRIVRSCLNFLRSRKMLMAADSWEPGDENDIVFVEHAILQWPIQARSSEFHGISQVYVAEMLGSKSPLGARSFEAWLKMCGKLNKNWKAATLSGYSAKHLIQIAASWNLISLVSVLLDTGTPVDIGANRGTALYRAGETGNEELVVMLLKAGAKPNCKGGHRGTPLEIAAMNSYSRVVDLVLARMSHDTESLNISLVGAAKACNMSLISKLIEQGADVDCLDAYGKSGLQIVCQRGHEAAVKLFLSKGAAVDPQDSRHESALQAVAQWIATDGGTDPARCERLATYLLDAGADVNYQGGKTGNALQAALTYRSMVPSSFVHLLLDAGANINAKGGEMGTCLQAAASSGQVEMLRVLLDRGVSIDEQGGQYGTALHAAANLPSSQFFAGSSALYLLERGADIHIDSPLMGSLLQSAAYGGCVILTSKLLAMGLDVNVQNGMYGNALHAAVLGDGGVPMVKLLLDHGADINAVGEGNGSPIEAAISRGHHLTLRLLVERGADTQNTNGPRGNNYHRMLFWDNYPTPLLFAARRGRIECVQELLNAGLDINAKGVRYGNVFCAAVYSNKLDVVKLLLDKGVKADAEMIDECLRREYMLPTKKMRQLLLEIFNDQIRLE